MPWQSGRPLKHHSGMRVLVVEDGEGIAAGLKAHLRKLGLAVDVADGVASAVRWN